MLLLVVCIWWGRLTISRGRVRVRIRGKVRVKIRIRVKVRVTFFKCAGCTEGSIHRVMNLMISIQ